MSAAQKYALLKCMEFFRDELYYGDQTPRIEKRYRELRSMCAEALGNPSMTDAKRIEDSWKSTQVVEGYRCSDPMDV